MRASSISLPVHRAARGRFGSALAGVLVALLAAAACVQSAWANSPHYTLAIVEGETTLPEFPIESVSGSAPGDQEVVIKIIHNGTEVVRSQGEGGAWTSRVPAAGDTVTLESPAGTTIGSVVYDGKPTMDPTVCAGSVNFSGQRSEGEEVEGGYVSLSRDRYGHPKRTGFGSAQVTTLSGTTYSGNFLSALSSGETVSAIEKAKISLGGGGTFEYKSENERPVGSCPAPPLPPPPPPAPIVLPLHGSIAKLLHTTILKLLKFGLSDQVTINQAGTVTQDLYLQGGALPAHAASASRRHRARPALLLAHGSSRAKGAGEVTVHLKLTRSGRSRLRGATRVKAVLITTLRTAGGQVLNVGRRSVSLHR